MISIIDTVKGFDNLEIVGAVRHDTVMYDLPPAPTGKRGRPRKKGDRLDIKEFPYSKTREYYVAERKVITNLVEKAVYVTVTTNIETFSSVRAYISRINPDETKILTTQESLNNQNQSKIEAENKTLIIHRMRWDIEIIFYQHKFFWVPR